MKSEPNDYSRISLTAHYTGRVWRKNQLSDVDLSTLRGSVLYHLARPFNFLTARLSHGTNLETFLVDRHRMIDQILTNEIETGRVTQVVELAAGLSPRGEKFMRRYQKSHGLVYIESDLPEQIAIKRRLLQKAGGGRLLGHHFAAIDATSDDGVFSLGAATAALLNHSRGCAVISEGLLSYLDTPVTLAMWGRTAKFLSSFASGVYLTDLHLINETPKSKITAMIQRGIEFSARGRLHLHFQDAPAAEQALKDAGFLAERVLLRSSSDRDGLLRFVRARTGVVRH